MSSRLALAAVGVVLAIGPAFAQDEDVDWQTAVGELAAEKARAESCVSVLKRHAAEDLKVLSHGQIQYSEAKADVDAVVEALVVGLAQGDTIAFPEIERRIRDAAALREDFCKDAYGLIEPSDENTRQAAAAIAQAVAQLIAAAKEIYLFRGEGDRLTRATIGTHVEGQKWRLFEEIPP